MKNILIAIITIATLMVYNQTVAQNNCDLDVIVPVKGSDTEIDVPLPELTPPDDVPEILSTGEKRLVYFIHGLNGDNESWITAASVVDEPVEVGNLQYPGYQLISFTPNYKHGQSSLINSRGALETELIGFNPINLPANYDLNRGIAIAHSQGGIVGRALDKRWSHKNSSGNFTHGDNRVFGGLVTLATPNQGAQILNNKNLIHGLVYDLADELSEGPYRELRNSDSYFVELMASLVNLPEIRDSIVRFIGNQFGSFLIAENMPGITKEYTVPDNSEEGLTSEIPKLNAYIPAFYDEQEDKEVQTRLVAFYAVGDLIKTYHDIPLKEIVGWEDGPYISMPIWETKIIEEIIVPISWGTIHFQLKDYSPNNYPPFQADNEDYLTAYRAHQTKHFYDSKVMESEQKRIELRIKQQNLFGGKLNPKYYDYRYRIQKAQKRRDAWKRGSVKLSKFDELYRIVIGARYHETETITTSELVCECTNGLMTIERSMAHCDTGHGLPFPEGIDWDCELVVKQTTKHISVWRNKESDGVVLVESQRDIPQNTWEPQRLDNVTHMQVRNSQRTAEMLRTVFSGGVGHFFITPEIED